MTWLRSHKCQLPAGAATGSQSVWLRALAPNPTSQGPLQLPGHSLKSPLQVGSPLRNEELGHLSREAASLGPTPCAVSTPVFSPPGPLVCGSQPEHRPGGGSRLQSPQALQTQLGVGGRKWELGRRNQELSLV